MDTVDRRKRSWIMGQIKSQKNSSTELALLRVLKRERITGWRRNYNVFGRPDFAFPSKRVAVFVDGCFWHGHPTLCRIPSSNREYWKRKIDRNRVRDRKVNRELRRRGWRVLRIWEHLIDQPRTKSRLHKALNSDNE